MYSFCLRISIVAVLLLAVTHQSSANSAAAAQILSSANALLANDTLPQEYKDLLMKTVQDDSGVTYTSPTRSKSSARFSPTATFGAAPDTKCGAYCCGVSLTPRRVSYSERVPSTCYHKVTTYYRTKCGWFCRRTASKVETRSHSCTTYKTSFRTETPVCRADQYTRCCEGHVKFGGCCINIEGLRVILDLIKVLLQFRIPADSPFVNLIGRK